MSSGVRVSVPSEFAVHTLLEIIVDNHSQTKTHVRSQFKHVSGKACRVTLQGDATKSLCGGCCAKNWRLERDK